MSRRFVVPGPVAALIGVSLLTGCSGSDPPTGSSSGSKTAPAVSSSGDTAALPTTVGREALRGDLVTFYRLIQSRQTGPARVRIRKHLILHPDDGQAEFLFGLSYHREKRYGRKG